jgi:hypothetical protein
MFNNIKDMSMAEIEIELINARNKNDKLTQIQNMVLNLKNATVVELVLKIEEIHHLLGQMKYDLTSAKDTQTVLEIPRIKPYTALKPISKTSAMKNAITDLLHNEKLTSKDVHQKLSERGLVSAIGSEKGRDDYNITRSIIAGLKKEGQIEQLSNKRGSVWQIITGAF